MQQTRARRRVLFLAGTAVMLDKLLGSQAKGALLQHNGAGVGAYPAWMRAQPIHSWFEIPGTRLSSVDPVRPPAGNTRNKVDAWNGAALQVRNSVLWMGLSGGHADYAGNEINRIVLSSDAPRWEEVRPPSRLDFSKDGKNWTVPYYQDGTPASRHTYNNQQFIDAENRLCWVGGGAVWGYGGRGSESFDYWDVVQGSFGTYANPQHLGESLRGADSLVVKHPRTEDMYFSRGDTARYVKWTRSTNSWQLIKKFGMSLSRCCAGIDPRSGVLLRIGPAGSADRLLVHAWEADTGENAPGVVTLKGDAAEWFASVEITRVRGAALEWCGALNAFVYYCGFLAPSQAIVIDPKRWTAEFLALKGLTIEKLIKPQYNRFRYMPELKAFVLVDKWDGNLKCFRVSSV